MKGDSERQVGDMIRRLGAFAYKPPDDARNRKPCDFFVWRLSPDDRYQRSYVPIVDSIWIEVKDPAGLSMPATELRPSQRAGVAVAMKLGIPYWLVVRWRRYPGIWSATELSDPMMASLWERSLTPERSGVEGGLMAMIRHVLGVHDDREAADGQPREALRTGAR